MRLSPGLAVKGGLVIALGLSPTVLHLVLAADRTGGAAAPGMARYLDGGLIAVSAIIHTSIYLVLLATFGVTLLPGRDPFVTRLARRIHGSISPAMVAYTRGITWVWVLFFAGELLASLLLYLLAPIYVWSLFVNVLNLPLIVLIFAVEHVYRRSHLSDPPRYSPADIVRMMGYIKDSITKQASSG